MTTAFERYEKLRASGKINMADCKNVCLLAKLSREEYFDILQNYGKHKEQHEMNQERKIELAREYDDGEKDTNGEQEE